MRKLMTVIAVGEVGQSVYRISQKHFETYAKKHGWELKVLDTIPDEFKKRFPGRSTGQLCNLYKLEFPKTIGHYDLAANFDADLLINSDNAEDLAESAHLLPTGGIAGVETTTHQERPVYFPNWSPSHFDTIDPLLPQGVTIGDRTRHINGGVILFKPQEVIEPFERLLAWETAMHEEDRINVGLVSHGKCHFLEPAWNTVWGYVRIRNGLEAVYKKRGSLNFYLGRITNKKLWKWIEPKHITRYYKQVKILHFQGESHKMPTLAPYCPPTLTSR